MFADGALGPRTALMLEGYDSAPQELGIAVTPPQQMAEAVRRANSAGLACAIHAIGDRAVRDVLDIYQEQQQPLRGGAARAIASSTCN